MENLYSKNPLLSWRKIGEEVLILDTKGQKKSHSLNKTASFIWDKIDGKNNHNTLISLVMNHFNVSKEQANKDLDIFLVRLLENELILKHVQ
jgi:hypothetical protein